MSDDTVKDQTDNQTKWERHENGNIPCNAVYAGGKCYIVRVMHLGSRLVGSIIEGDNCAYCGFKGVAYSHYEYQIFVESEIQNNTKLRWKWTDGKVLPENAIMGGHYVDQMLFIGRVCVDNQILVGSYNKNTGTVYVPYKGKEYGVKGCDILCNVDV